MGLLTLKPQNPKITVIPSEVEGPCVRSLRTQAQMVTMRRMQT